MKAFICILALASAVNGGLIAPAPLSLGHVHLHDGGLGGLGGLSGGLGGGLSGGLGGGLILGGGHIGGSHLGGLGTSHQVIRVIHQEQPHLIAPAPQLVKVIHHQQAPAQHVKVIRLINEAPLIHHAPAPVSIVKVLHQAPVHHHIPSGW